MSQKVGPPFIETCSLHELAAQQYRRQTPPRSPSMHSNPGAQSFPLWHATPSTPRASAGAQGAEANASFAFLILQAPPSLLQVLASDPASGVFAASSSGMHPTGVTLTPQST